MHSHRFAWLRRRRASKGSICEIPEVTFAAKDINEQATAARDECSGADSKPQAIQSRFMSGSVVHVRHRGVMNSYRYDFPMVLLDLDELQSSALVRDRWYFSVDRPNLLSFQRKDHLGDPAEPLKVSVLKLIDLECRTENEPNPAHKVGKMLMLTLPSCFAFKFTPITIFYCMAAADPSHCAFIVLDVCDLPWQDRHYYVLQTSERISADPTMLDAQFVKAMHVSPFFRTDGAYHVRMNHPGNYQLKGSLCTIIALHDVKQSPRATPCHVEASTDFRDDHAKLQPRFLSSNAPQSSKNTTWSVLGDKLLTAVLELKPEPLYDLENGSVNHCLLLLCQIASVTWKAYLLVHFQTAKTWWKGEAMVPVVHFTCDTLLKASVFHVYNALKVILLVLCGGFLVLSLNFVAWVAIHRVSFATALVTASAFCVAFSVTTAPALVSN
ncbi:hypothetical protein FI667_g15069, partial [Globisporangium splendens]